MLQFKTFPLSEDKKANEFIKTARVIKDGFHFVDGHIIIEHDVLEEFDIKAQEDTLKTQLERAKVELFNAEMAKDFYALMEQGGRMDTASAQKKGEAFGAVEGAKAQIYLLSKKLGLDTHGMEVFGKKQYTSKEKK
jgi:hypothetical protein